MQDTISEARKKISPLNRILNRINIELEYDKTSDRYVAKSGGMSPDMAIGIAKGRSLSFDVKVLNKLMSEHNINATFEIDDKTGIVTLDPSKYSEIRGLPGGTYGEEYNKAYSKIWEIRKDLKIERHTEYMQRMDDLQIEGKQQAKSIQELDSEANNALCLAMQSRDNDKILAVVDKYVQQFDKDADGRMDKSNGQAIVAAFAKLEGYNADDLKKMASTINNQLTKNRQNIKIDELRTQTSIPAISPGTNSSQHK